MVDDEGLEKVRVLGDGVRVRVLGEFGEKKGLGLVRVKERDILAAAAAAE